MRFDLRAIGVVMLLICPGVWGCGYPEVSPKSYELSKALYSACNRRSDEHVSRVVELVTVTQAAGEISDRESKWLRAIADQAREGEWEAATLEARQIMEDQINR